MPRTFLVKTSKKKDEQCLRESSENKLEVLSVITEKFDNNRETVGEHEEASYDKEKANHRPVTENDQKDEKTKRDATKTEIFMPKNGARPEKFPANENSLVQIPKKFHCEPGMRADHWIKPGTAKEGMTYDYSKYERHSPGYDHYSSDIAHDDRQRRNGEIGHDRHLSRRDGDFVREGRHSARRNGDIAHDDHHLARRNSDDRHLPRRNGDFRHDDRHFLRRMGDIPRDDRHLLKREGDTSHSYREKRGVFGETRREWDFAFRHERHRVYAENGMVSGHMENREEQEMKNDAEGCHTNASNTKIRRPVALMPNQCACKDCQIDHYGRKSHEHSQVWPNDKSKSPEYDDKCLVNSDLPRYARNQHVMKHDSFSSTAFRRKESSERLSYYLQKEIVLKAEAKRYMERRLHEEFRHRRLDELRNQHDVEENQHDGARDRHDVERWSYEMPVNRDDVEGSRYEESMNPRNVEEHRHGMKRNLHDMQGNRRDELRDPLEKINRDQQDMEENNDFDHRHDRFRNEHGDLVRHRHDVRENQRKDFDNRHDTFKNRHDEIMRDRRDVKENRHDDFRKQHEESLNRHDVQRRTQKLRESIEHDGRYNREQSIENSSISSNSPMDVQCRENGEFTVSLEYKGAAITMDSETWKIKGKSPVKVHERRNVKVIDKGQGYRSNGDSHKSKVDGDIEYPYCQENQDGDSAQDSSENINTIKSKDIKNELKSHNVPKDADKSKTKSGNNAEKRCMNSKEKKDKKVRKKRKLNDGVIVIDVHDVKIENVTDEEDCHAGSNNSPPGKIESKPDFDKNVNMKNIPTSRKRASPVMLDHAPVFDEGFTRKSDYDHDIKPDRSESSPDYLTKQGLNTEDVYRMRKTFSSGPDAFNHVPRKCKWSPDFTPKRGFKTEFEESSREGRRYSCEGSNREDCSPNRNDYAEDMDIKELKDFQFEVRGNFIIKQRASRDLKEREKREIIRRLKEKDAGKKSRAVANWLERKRVAELNEAFELLRRIVPTYGNEDRSLSKIKTLRYASTYIGHLAMISEKQCLHELFDVKSGLVHLLELDPLFQRCQEHLETRCVI